MKTLNIGLFGFGVVGEGIYKVLRDKPSLNCRVKKVCIKHAHKPRNAPATLFTTNANELLNDPKIDVIVELIDDAEQAFAIVKTGFENGKSVVSANKKMIAENLGTLIALQRKHKVSFLYEAAVCGSIPILRNLEEYFDNDLLKQVNGIVNGSTNYILTQMFQQGIDYQTCLKKAQELGFAESNPTLDVEGFDASYKLAIISLHAHGKLIPSSSILRKGITALTPDDFQFAREKGYQIKLVASTSRSDDDTLFTSVFPTFVSADHALSQVQNEYNGVIIGSTLSDEQFLSGKGAGRYPTSSAVLSDLSALRYGYKYEFKKGTKPTSISHSATQKFYVGAKNSSPVDLNIFKSLETHHRHQDGEYAIGEIELTTLASTDFWKSPDVSIISFNQAA